MKRGGCKYGDGKTRGCPFSKKGGCSFAVGTQAQRVSAPPPPGLGDANWLFNLYPLDIYLQLAGT